MAVSAAEQVDFTIVTGLSGAGKTQAMKSLEDLGFFCIDNLPPLLLPQLVELHQQGKSEQRRYAVAIDIRGREYFHHFNQALEWLGKSETSHQVLFLECNDSVLLRRFSETRRRHPLMTNGSLLESIAQERELLADVRDRADHLIDTSQLKAAELKQRLSEGLTGRPLHESLTVEVVSFGFKYGVPMDVDIMFDVRFLPNPFYIDELKPLTGNDQPVYQWVLDWPQTQLFLDQFYPLFTSLIPAYGREGKARLSVAVGCTGGQHRSVSIANRLGELLAEEGIPAHVRHRDVELAERAS